MSVIWYDGIALSYVSTNSVSFEPINDPVAGVDLLYVRVRIDVNAIIAPEALPGLGGESAATTITRIEHLLSTPRRGLVLSSNSVNIVTVLASGAAVTLENTALPALDANNGPFPEPVVITKLLDGSIAINFKVTACIVDCAGGTSLPWISHKYSESHDLTDLGMTKRTRTGSIITRTDMLTDPDSLRGLVAPPLEPEFRRISSRYQIDPAGNRLNYEFIDEEVYLTPPDPSAKAEGWYQVSTNNGAAHYAEVGVTLRGGKPTDKGVLMSRVISIAYAKLIGPNPNDPLIVTNSEGKFMLLGTFREELYENAVSVRMRAMLRPPKSRKYGINADLSGFGIRPAGSEAGTPPFDPGTRGSAQLTMIAGAMNDPCLRLTVLTASPQSPNLPNLRSTNVPAAVSISTILPDDQSALRTSDPGIYEDYKLRSMTSKQEHKLQMPVGKKGAPASILQTAEPTFIRTVEFEATKIGGPPKIPTAYNVDRNVELLTADVDTGQVEPTPDGVTLRYTVSGRYVWAYKDGAKVAYASTLPPWVSLYAGQAVLVPYELSPNIVAWPQVGTGNTLTTTGAAVVTPSVSGGTGTFSTGSESGGTSSLTSGQFF